MWNTHAGNNGFDSANTRGPQNSIFLLNDQFWVVIASLSKMQRRHISLRFVHFYSHAPKFPQRAIFSTLTLAEQIFSSLPSYTLNNREPREWWWVHWLDYFLVWTLLTAWLVTDCLLSWGFLGKLLSDSSPVVTLSVLFPVVSHLSVPVNLYFFIVVGSVLQHECCLPVGKKAPPSDRGSYAGNCKCSGISLGWRTGIWSSWPPKDGCVGWRMLLPV